MMNSEHIYNLTVLSALPGLIVCKNSDLKYIGANLNAVKNFGFKTIDDMIGQSVFDVRCPLVECADVSAPNFL